MIGKISHEEFLMHGRMIQFGLLPSLVTGHKVREVSICIIQLFIERWELAHFISITVCQKNKINIMYGNTNRVWCIYLSIGSLSILPKTVVEGMPKTLSIMCTKPLVLATSAWIMVALTPPPSTVMTSSSPSPLMLKYRNVWLLRVGTWAIYWRRKLVFNSCSPYSTSLPILPYFDSFAWYSQCSGDPGWCAYSRFRAFCRCC